VRARLGGLLLVPFIALAGSGVSVAHATAQQGVTHPAERIGPAVSAGTLISQFENCLEPGFDYSAPRSGAPVPQRLTVDRSCGQDLLQAVDPAVKPAISGDRAYRLCVLCPSDLSLSEELLYYSAATPAVMPARCEPQPGLLVQQMPADCSTASTPIYQHRLVWFFISKVICTNLGGGLGGPMIPVGAMPRPPRPPMSGPCITFTDVDAMTGAQGFSTSG
jgi:hypothetical protein